MTVPALCCFVLFVNLFICVCVRAPQCEGQLRDLLRIHYAYSQAHTLYSVLSNESDIHFNQDQISHLALLTPKDVAMTLLRIVLLWSTHTFHILCRRKAIEKVVK